MITNVFVPFFHCLALNSFNENDFDLPEENMAVATLQHQICMRAFKSTCHLVGPEIRVCSCQVSAVALARKMFFKHKIRRIHLNFLFLAQRYSIWSTKKKLEK